METYHTKSEIIKSFKTLKSYCENENYQGWDPYDGLNSKIFQATWLRHWSFARLAWIQLFKRNPINLRRLLIVPKGYNSKGVGLFLTGYCNLYHTDQSYGEELGYKNDALKKIYHLANKLLDIRNKNYDNTCWGYNFDWQNRVFYQPYNTPTVVATSFCGEALFRAYEITNENRYLENALSACNFVTNDLNRTVIGKDQFIFSYSPLDETGVYNASLLGAKLLAIGYTYTGNDDWLNLSLDATRTIVNKQSYEGAWIYGEDKVQCWVDSFHTGFNLECIWKVMSHTGDKTFMSSFNNGLDYYLANFFLSDGTPKYYNNKIYPLDVHSPAQLIATLSTSGLLKKHKKFADKVLDWTKSNMQDNKGFFYYQLKKGVSSKIPYMRWAQAWMFYAYTEYLKSMLNENLD